MPVELLFTPITPSITLYPYQRDGVIELRRKYEDGKRRVLLQAATASGKTVVACEVMRRAVAKGSRVLFLAHVRELIEQCSRKLRDFGIEHGVIMAGRGYNLDAPVQVVSKDTLLTRGVRTGKIKLPPANLVVLDEAHRALSDGYLNILHRYYQQGARILGLTATPARGDGRGLGDVFQDMVRLISSKELIEQGFIVPTRVFAPTEPDLKGVRVSGNDYDRDQLEARMNKGKLVGDIVEHWLQLAKDRQTIVFAVGIKHSLALVERFQNAGVKSAHIDGDTPLDKRDKLIRQLTDGDIQVLCNAAVFVEGTDIPPVSCVVLAKPTRSIVRHLQMAGRARRKHPGKVDALLIDHAGNVYQHGMPDDEVEWDLDVSDKIQDRRERLKKEGKIPVLVICPRCYREFIDTRVCPGCGHEVPRKPRDVPTRPGKLEEITVVPSGPPTYEQVNRYWHFCLGTMAHKGWTVGAAAHMFKRRFGHWPTSDLDNVPTGADWRKPVAVLYAQYLRRRVRTT
jgi:superfamily II DNA or RNA helicase